MPIGATREQIVGIQLALLNAGASGFAPSGVMDGPTIAGLKTFQQAVGIPASGQLDDATIAALMPFAPGSATPYPPKVVGAGAGSGANVPSNAVPSLPSGGGAVKPVSTGGGAMTSSSSAAPFHFTLTPGKVAVGVAAGLAVMVALRGRKKRPASSSVPPAPSGVGDGYGYDFDEGELEVRRPRRGRKSRRGRSLNGFEVTPGKLAVAAAVLGGGYWAWGQLQRGIK